MDRLRSRPFNWLFFCFALSVIILFGGASRADAASQPIVRVVSIVAAVVWAIRINREQLKSVAIPLSLLCALALLIAAQLIPLPPEIWSQLPGRQIFVEGYQIAGIDPAWHAFSVTPDRTINSLLAVFPPIAVVLGIATLRDDESARLPTLLIGLVVLSAVISILQVSSGTLYFYRVTNAGSAVGLFANRNHEAIMLACCFPLLACWALRDSAGRPVAVRGWFALAIGFLLVPLLLLTGSRAGMVFGAVGAVAAAFIAWLEFRSTSQRARSRFSGKWLIMAAVGIAGLLVAATVMARRDAALQRLLNIDNTEEVRTVNLPVYGQMATDYFPWGSGFGSFDPMFRIYEPTDTLGPNYLNHAHNEVAEIAIEGGLAALLIVGCLALWALFGMIRAWLPSQSRGSTFSRVASVILLILGAGSLVDYPLRTPALMSFAAIALVWLRGIKEASRRRDGLAASGRSDRAGSRGRRQSGS